MRAEIVSVGTELLLGHTINKDAAIVARILAEMGIDLLHQQTVGDNGERLANALELAVSRSEVVFTTGGLGPTDDDLTKNSVAAVAGVPLVEDSDTTESLKEYFGARAMSANQIRQAYMPAGAVIFPNDIGTAPGCAVSLASGGHIIMLPGPPRELTHMLEKYVRPFLAQLIGGAIVSREVHVFGMGEGVVAETIKDLMTAANPSVAPYAHAGEMFVKITAKAASVDQGAALCEPVIAQVRERLGDVVYGIDVPNLETLVVHELMSRYMTLATAESCTGGLLAKRVTDIPGSSAVFGLGMVTYANSAKENELGVPADLLQTYGAVSPQVAQAMAENIRRIAKSDLGLATTGIAGPDGGSSAKPLGLVYIALAWADGCHVRKMEPTGRYLGRSFVRERTASTALDLVRRHIMGFPLDFTWR